MTTRRPPAPSGGFAQPVEPAGVLKRFDHGGVRGAALNPALSRDEALKLTQESGQVIQMICNRLDPGVSGARHDRLPHPAKYTEQQSGCHPRSGWTTSALSVPELTSYPT